MCLYSFKCKKKYTVSNGTKKIMSDLKKKSDNLSKLSKSEKKNND